MSERRGSDDLLVQMLRDGRHDAEIGVRLGITTGEVRQRKAELRGRLGDDAYLRLLDPTRRPRRFRRWKRLALVLAGIAAVVAVLLAVANLIVGGEEQIAAVRTVPSPTARPTPKAAATVTIDGELFEDAGPFISLSDPSLPVIGTTDTRPGFAVVSLNRTAYISASEFARWAVVSGGRGQLRLRATLNGREVDVQVSTTESQSRLRSLSGGLGPIAEITSALESLRAYVIVRAFDSNGRQLQAHVATNGRLFVATQTFPGNWIIDRSTGQRLAVETPLSLGGGSYSAAPPTNFCKGDGADLRCGITWLRSGGLTVAEPGTLICVPGGFWFESRGVRLEFATGLSLSGPNNYPCPPRAVTAGEVIIPAGDWEVLAVNLDGAPLSVGVTVGGGFIVGRFSGTLLCPCLTVQ